MLFKQYIVRTTNPDLAQHLVNVGQKSHWMIVANSLESAWRKFQRQQFGDLLPDPTDYDISLHSTFSR